ncbi:MAG TPA: hypothetical protein VI137_03205 [Pseudolabrys sp.]|jgi:hypothetical protein
MKKSRNLRLATMFATGLALSGINGLAGAEESATVPTDPGFKAGTGQINPGITQQASSQSEEIIDIPTPEESRRALLEPVSKQPSLGGTPSAPRPDAQTFGGPNAKQESQNAVGGPQGLTTVGSAPDSSASKTGAQAATASANGISSGEPPPSGPIGSFGETIPAKFSKRNDILDRTPIMAWPLRLNDQQRMQIFDAVMAENSQPVAGADALKPASELSPDQALNGMRPLPENVRSIDGVERLYYLKAKDKVLLIEPATRTVVSEITS